MAYFLHGEQPPGHSLVYGYKALDGDYRKVRPVDMTRDEGKRFSASMPSQERPVETEFLPTRVQVGGPKRQLADVQADFLNWMVNDTFKEVLERLEPGVHQ